MLEMKKRTNYLSIYPCISVLREGIAEPSIEREGENVSIKEQGTDVTIKGKAGLLLCPIFRICMSSDT